MKNNRYPIIDPMEVLEPLVIIMSKGCRSHTHAKVYTKREWDFIEDCMKNGLEVDVKLKR